MAMTIYCGLEQHESLLEHLDTDICDIAKVKWEGTVCASLILFVVNVYMLIKWKRRSQTNLLTYHNIRAATALLLLVVNIIEVARAFLPIPTNNKLIKATSYADLKGSFYATGGNKIYKQSLSHSQQPGEEQLQNVIMVHNQISVVIGADVLANAFAAITLTIMLMWYHRVVEVKKTVEFLYVSCTMSLLIFILRLYELLEIIYFESAWQLEPCIQLFSAACLFGVGVIDGFTVFKERYRPEYLEDVTKIGYKHSFATFYSKVCFWWLTPLLWFGYTEPLELDDLGQMRIEDTARAYYDRFLLIYKTGKAKNHNQAPSLWLSYIKSSWRMFILGGVLKVFGDLFAIIGPLAVQQIVQYIEIMYGLHYDALLQHMSNSISRINTLNGYISGRNNTLITFEKGTFSKLNHVRPGVNGMENEYVKSRIATNTTERDNADYSSILKHIISTRATGHIMEAYESVNSSTIYHKPYIRNNYGSLENQNYKKLMPINFDYFHTNESRGSSQALTDIKILYVTWLDLVTNGWTIACIVLLAAIAQGALSQASTHILNMTGIRIKTSLQGLIYRKTLLLNSAYCIAATNTTNSNGQQQGTINATTLTVNTHNIENVKYKLSTDNNSSKRKMNDVSKEASISTTTTTTTAGAAAAATATNEGNTKNTRTAYSENIWEQQSNGLSNVGAITNLMSEDTLNVMSFFWIAHYIWAIPLKIAMVMYLLYSQLGISAIIGSVVCILTMTPLQFLIGKAMSRNTEIMAKCTDDRLRKLHDTLLGIKVIKLNGWDQIFIKKINQTREEELKYLNKDTIYWTLITILTHISTVLITFVTLTVYVYWEADDESENITPSRLFTALALFQQLTVPLLIFPITVPIILSAIMSTKRLEQFFDAPEIQKQFEGVRNMARILSKSNASLDIYEQQQQQHSITNNFNTQKKCKGLNDKPNINFNIPEKPAPLVNSEPQTPLHVATDTFTYREDHQKRLSLQVRKDLLRNTPYVVIRPKKLQCPPYKRADSWHRDSLLLKMSDDIAVSIKEGKYVWNPNKMENVISIKDVTIPKGKLTMVIGENGSGKSSFLSALLMEMPLISGDMIWNKTSTLAYVPQQPWLLNVTIRENILFGESFQPKRYAYVLKVSALKLDIERMPMGDLTVVGERGVNLSSGQKQRVAIARALYSSANVVIMDDLLASLDNDVAKYIFEQCIEKMLLKGNRTVILVTQQLHLIHQANYLIILKNGCLEASGNYKDLEITHPHVIAKWKKTITTIKKDNESRGQLIDELQLQLDNERQHTARERWKLYKNLVLSLKRGSSDNNKDHVDNFTTNENILTVFDSDEDSSVMTSTFLSSNKNFKLKRSSSSIYGSRHLLYEIPLPIDEYQTENVLLRRRRRTASSSCADSGKCSSSRNTRCLSNISETPSELRHSLLSNGSCSYMTNFSNFIDEIVEHAENVDEIKSDLEVTNINNSIDNLQHFNEDDNGIEEKVGNRFQKFLKLSCMSTRKSPKVIELMGGQRTSLPKQADNCIKSISAEFINSSTSSDALAVTPFEELSGITALETNYKAETVFDWRATSKSEREDFIPDANSVDNVMATIKEEAPIVTTTINAVTTEHETMDPSSGKTIHQQQQQLTKTSVTTAIVKASAQRVPLGDRVIKKVTTTTTTTSTSALATRDDVERKYGQIPAEVYLLYVRASGYTIVFIFFITALIWQSCRIYTDVWLQQWGDYINNATTVQQQQQQQYEQQNTHSRLIHRPRRGQKTYIDHVTENVNVNVDGDGGNVVYAEDILKIEEPHKVTYYFRIYAAISFVCITMALISIPTGQWAGCRARRQLHHKLLHAIMHKSLYFFERTSIGRIMNRFSYDMDVIDKKIAATSQRLLQFSLLCLCALLINVAITPWFILLTIPVCMAYYVIQKFYRRSWRELQRIENATNTPILAHLTETLEGVATIRAYRQETHFTEILFKRLEENTVAFIILNTSNRWLGVALDYLGSVLVFVATLTALSAATFACNQHTTQVEAEEVLLANSKQQQLQQQQAQNGILLNLKSHMLSPAPSLVGLAINYTLLMPIYLNWVVKLLTDMEMYAGSVKRIAYYADVNFKTTTTTASQTAIAVEIVGEKKDDVLKSRREESKAYCRSYDDGIIDAGKFPLALLMNTKDSQDDKLGDIGECNDMRPINVSQKYNEMKATLITAVANIKYDNDDGYNDNNKQNRHPTNDNEQQNLQHQPQVQQNLDIVAGNGGYEKVNIRTSIAKILPKPKTTTDDCCNELNKTIAKTATSTRGSNNNIKFLQTSECNNAQHQTVLRSPFIYSVTHTRCCCCSSGALPNQHKQYQPVPISWPQHGNIFFQNVSLRYEGQYREVIKNVSLNIPAGQKLGICGRTGSGKSSLALSLFGVLQVSTGRICIDDIDLSLIHPDEIRNRLSIIPQDVHLFSSTIRDNLDPAGYYTDLELWQCLEFAHLKEFISNHLPMGLDTEIVEGGLNLSLGHRQLLCLARAILRGSACLILDEATSVLDNASEKALLHTARQAFHGRTIITIAHRLASILDYDRIIVLENGQIIEDGTPQQLQQRSDSIFCSLLHSGRSLSS